MTYTIINISRWSEGCTGVRALLCYGGVLSIGMAIVCSFGICSALGLFYSPLTGVLPFLILGIGVDDMFVIVNAYDLTSEKLPVPERIALALAEAGSSVTVTSLTDILAFFIGSFTALPALRCFSIYAAFACLFDYLFQVRRQRFPPALPLPSPRSAATGWEVIVLFSLLLPHSPNALLATHA